MRLGNQKGDDVRVNGVLACIGLFALPSVVTAQVPPKVHEDDRKY